MKKSLLVISLVATAGLILLACGSKADNLTPQTGKPIATVKINDLTATLSNSTGQLKTGDQELTLSFTDASGKPVDVDAAWLNFHMPAMGSMAAMNSAVTFTTTSTPGVYNGKVKIDHAGEWQAQLAYEGSAGKGKGTFSVTTR
jgi:hypothetical protein